MKKALGPVTLAYPMPAFLVAAYDEEGKANIMTAAWGGICCSNPPCIAVSVRPERWTHKAIVARKAFTVCVPSAAQAAMVDFAGMVSGAKEDKFSATGLTAVHSKVVDTPYVDECPLVLECELQATLELGSHTQFVGRILNVGIETDCLNEAASPTCTASIPCSTTAAKSSTAAWASRWARPFPWAASTACNIRTSAPSSGTALNTSTLENRRQ